MKVYNDFIDLFDAPTPQFSSDSIQTISNILTNNTSNSDVYNTIVRKIDYRDIEYNKLKSINSIINIVYYILLILLFVLLFSENNLLLKERFLFYLFLILLPYLYPWIYILIKKIWTSLFPDTLTEGPKNAFLNNIDTNLPDYTTVPNYTNKPLS
jgi:hypothetical protein